MKYRIGWIYLGKGRNGVMDLNGFFGYRDRI